MTKNYLITLFSLVFIFGGFSSVFSQALEVDTSLESRPVRVESQMRINGDFKTIHETQRAQLEEQREQIKTEAEARRAAAQARGDEAQARREEIRLEIEARWAKQDERRAAARVEAEAKRAEAMAKRAEFQRAAAERKIENVTRIALATIERLEQIIVRIESRIGKVGAQGGDTTESKRYVSVAKGNLSDARLVVETFATIDLSGDEARENFERIRTAAAAAREHIRSAHQNLMMAVRSLISIEITVEADVSVE